MRRRFTQGTFMNLRNTALLSSALAAGTLLALAAPLAASAHVTVEPSSSAAGSYSVLTFALGHGCEGSPTTAITIDIPEGIASATPTVNPGWDVAKIAVEAAEPATDSHGEAATSRTGQIVYTAKAPLPDGIRDTFEVSVKLPDDAAGDTLAFPVLQTCEVGETRWDEVTADGEAEPQHPAPTISVTAATEAGNGHGGGNTDPASAASSDAASSASPAAGDDVVARGLGIGGLVLGAISLVIALTSRRTQSA
jgi:uncharacterized protein YcnI